MAGAGECLEAVSAELSFFTLPNCFELFGFDLLVDEDWHLWLLEVCRSCRGCYSGSCRHCGHCYANHSETPSASAHFGCCKVRLA